MFLQVFIFGFTTAYTQTFGTFCTLETIICTVTAVLVAVYMLSIRPFIDPVMNSFIVLSECLQVCRHMARPLASLVAM